MYFRSFLHIPKLTVSANPRLLFSWWRVWRTWPVSEWIMAAENFRKADFRSALKNYQEGLNNHPHHRAAHCAVLDQAYCHFRLGEVELALEKLQQLINSPKASRAVYQLHAKLCLFTGQRRAAIVSSVKLLRLYGDDCDAVVTASHILLSVNPGEKALKEVKEKLDEVQSRISVLDNKNSSINTALALYELRYADYQKGERMLTRVIAAGNPPTEAMLLLGEVLLEQNRLDQAREQFQRALNLSPNDPRPLMFIAKCYLRDISNNALCCDWAIQLSTSACQVSNWQNPEALMLLIEAYRVKGDQSMVLLISKKLKREMSINELSLERVDHIQDQVKQLRTIDLPLQRQASERKE